MAEDTVVPYDVKLNGKKYLILENTYHELPVRDTIRPFSTPGGDREFRDNDNPAWAWWGQSYWEGEGTEDWTGDAPYWQGVGIDPSDTGKLANANSLSQVLNDAGNPSGYFILTVNNTARLLVLRLDTGQSWYSDDGASWAGPVFVNGSSQGLKSWGFFRGALHVGMANGVVRTTNDGGATWVASSIPTFSASPAMILGNYRSKFAISWGSTLKFWDGTALTNPGNMTTDVIISGTPQCSAVGSGALFILTQGTPASLYIVQSNGQVDMLTQMAEWYTDFQPEDCIFTDTLYVVGGGPDLAGGQYGERWRYTDMGMELDYEFPQIHGTGVDYRIRSLAGKEGTIVYSYNKGFGIGLYDPTLDIYEDPILGTFISSRTNTPAVGTGIVRGLLYWRGLTYVGVGGQGIYRESGFCDLQVTSSLFGASSKRVNKMWNLAELTYAKLVTGQSITLEYSKDGGLNWSLLGTASYDAGDPNKTKSVFSFPTNYLSPVLQYRVTGFANNQPLSILDISISFIEVAANPKRVWRFVIELWGDINDPMTYRDDQPFERTSKQMKDELDALWNQRFVFQDIFGKNYNVMMPAPHTRMQFVMRMADDSNPDSVTGVEAQYTVNLVEV